MARKIAELGIALAVSAAAGAAVALPFNFILGADWAEYLASSAVIGLIIGLAAYAAFSLIGRWINTKPVYAFICVIAIVAAGTGGAVFLLATRDPLMIGGFVLVAEAAAVCATGGIYGLSRRMNRKLEELKKKLADDPS